MKIPNINDIVFVESDFYTGEARVAYIDMKSIYSDHLYPVQCEIDEENLNAIDSEYNHGQKVVRFSLNEVLNTRSKENIIFDEEEGSIFDDF